MIQPRKASSTISSASRVLELARRWHPTQIKWRRHLHQHPEIAHEEHETTAFLKNELGKLGLKFRPLSLKTGVIAELAGSAPGPTVAIRSDIDALPVPEQTGLPFASRIAGKMHACGHDMHMATVLGAAAVLSELKSELKGTVRFLFQPAEEVPPGGAILLIKDGALGKVDVIFGLHVDPAHPAGTIALCDGPLMANVYDFDIGINGKGSHAARPHLGVDAIATAAAVIDALQVLVSRRIDQSVPAVITIGQIDGGTARNVIAANVRLIGTARTLDPTMAKRIPGLIRQTVNAVCRAHGASAEITPVASYPMLINDPAVNRLYTDQFASMFGRRQVRIADRSLGGEDFAYYLQRVPGAMFRLGIRNSKIGADQPWHSSKFIADEDAIFYGTSLLAAATMKYAETGAS
ncbi:MAG: M20 family metallopeptidase [Candidatus Zixiibacteriota bacterium]